MGISLTANDVEHLFKCVFAARRPSLLKCLFISFAHFLNGLFACLLLLFNSVIPHYLPPSFISYSFSKYLLACTIYQAFGIQREKTKTLP